MQGFPNDSKHQILRILLIVKNYGVKSLHVDKVDLKKTRAVSSMKRGQGGGRRGSRSECGGAKASRSS